MPDFLVDVLVVGLLSAVVLGPVALYGLYELFNAQAAKRDQASRSRS